MDKSIIIENMQEVVNAIPSKFYCDMLYDSSANVAIRKTISGEQITTPHSRGYVFRVFDGEKFYEIADNDFDELTARIAKFMPKLSYHDTIQLPSSPVHQIDEEFPMIKNITEIPLSQKLDDIQKIFQQMQKLNEHVINPIVVYRDFLLKRIFVNSEGSAMRQVIPRTQLIIQPIVRIDNKIDFDYKIFSKEAGYEVLDDLNDEILESTIQKSIDLAQAPLPPSGVLPAVLDSSLSGLIAHESFGHGLEADQIIRGRSYLAPYYKKAVASDVVNISDSPVIPGEVGSYLFDDEGIMAEKTSLVSNGIFTNYIHSRLTAAILQETPHGNGRREGFLHPIYPRMSNTFFEPGDFNQDELYEGINDGVVLVKGYFGMEDPLGGGIQATSRKGYVIKNGERTTLTKGITLSGKVLNLLNSIDAVSKASIELDGGICGKGNEDYVPVTSGGVYIRVQKSIISPG